jgi:dTMP kinase
MYILFEGIDTCGKSTQIEHVAKNFKNVIVTKEPGGTQFGEKAREILLADTLSSKRAELLLFLADRAEHYQQIIKKNQDKIIISDRGFLSGIGYALANEDFEFNHLVELNRFALEGNFPDLIILFIIDIETLQKRTSQKTLDGIELRGLEYLISVQTHMQESLKKLDIPYLLIDATDSIETITISISNKISNM